MLRLIAVSAATLLLSAPTTGEPPAPPRAAADSILLTIFLRHDQSHPLTELNAQLEKNGWYTRFPPEGTEVVSWYVMMGVGQVVTLRVPPSRLRDVNLAIENAGWGAYRSEFYPTYDYRAIWQQEQAKHRR